MRKSIHLSLWCVVAAVMLGNAEASAQEGVELKLNLQQGQTYNMKMIFEQTIELPERDTTMQQRLATEMRFDVVEVESDGTQTLNVTYTHVSLKQQSPMGPVDFDSSRPPKNLPLTAQPFAALVDQQFTVTLSPRGQVRSLDGLDVIVEKMLAGLNMGEGPAKQAMIRSIREQFGPDAMKQNLQNLMDVYPDKPVMVGDTWSHKAAMKHGLPIISETTYKVTAITDDTVTLSSSSKISPNPEAEPLDMGTLKLRYTLGGTQRGTMQIDRTTGWTRQSDMTQSFTGTMTLMIGQQSMEHPMVISGKVSLISMP